MRNILSILAALLLLASCSSLEKPRVGKVYTTDKGMEIVFIERGEGPEADSGDVVAMHYTGKLANDSIFGSSYQRNRPLRFRLGNKEVIKGWEVAVDHMNEGDSAFLKIPPELAYGDEARGPIPENSTLKFMVRLVDVKKAPKPFDTTEAKRNKLENGLIMYMVKKGDGKELQKGDFVKVHYTGYFENGEIFDSSVEREAPIQIQLGENQVIRGWEEALKTMQVGDKARIIIPPELAYGEKGRGSIAPNTTLIFDVEVVQAHKPVEVEPYDVAGKDTTFTPTGLGIIKVKQTEGTKAVEGDEVTVHYTGYLENGEIFDSSVKAGKPITFQLGKNQVIPGWEEGLTHLREGEKARLIIPYQLAYGERGRGPIPPRATLIFDVELVKVDDNK